MCGIAGFFRSCSPAADKGTLRQMGQAILHRGPDAGGEYLDDHIGLAHRRLSIIDLSPQGNQPMFFDNNRLVIVFNGEIYNFIQLREQLQQEGVKFQTRTDTEVILALYQRYGTACLEKLNGMFAFAIWDKLQRTLFIARDRIGKKPLYYYHAGNDRIAFASEIKALLQLPGISTALEPTAIPDFLCYQYIPDPKTIYKNIYKLPPAHYLLLKVGDEPQIRSYWDINFRQPYQGTVEQAEDELLTLLQDATRIRMIADVPLGAFLSGGVDSSAVVALMAQATPDPVKTCTIGFQDKRHDESPYAREVANLFKTSHAEYTVQDHFSDTVSLLPRYFDEPFADSSAVPTYHVSQLARRSVTVALAGDGGDENFAGYSKYAVELREQLARQLIPKPLLSLIHSVSGISQHSVFTRKARSLSSSALMDPGRAFFRTNSCIEEAQLQQLLPKNIKHACSGYDPAMHTLRHWNTQHGSDHVAKMLYTDLKTYLPGDILVKVDRMSMAHALELRAPFLDYRIIEFAATLPSVWKIKGNSKKILLRKTFSRLLPTSILNRSKHGFTVPLDVWFRKDLKILAEQALFQQPAFAELISLDGAKQLWQQHQSAKQDHGSILWSLLMLSLWQREYQL